MIAQRYAVPAVALLFDVPDEELLARNERRPPGLRVPVGAILRFAARTRLMDAGDLLEEGFSAVHDVTAR